MIPSTFYTNTPEEWAKYSVDSKHKEKDRTSFHIQGATWASD